jgi:thiosulfate dehydrogenase [quinone] large subunit
MDARTATFQEPRLARWLFTSTAAAWIWLVVRVYLGYVWLHAGWGKLTGSEGGIWSWSTSIGKASWLKDNGAALKGFTQFVTSPAMTSGPNAANNFGWYRDFLHWVGTNASWISKVVTIGEILIGIGLILGAFTAIAAFFGALLNLTFGMSGIAGVNPLFFALAVLLILAWRNAGWIGLDRWLLPALGTPWQPGELIHVETEVVSVPSESQPGS